MKVCQLKTYSFMYKITCKVLKFSGIVKVAQAQKWSQNLNIATKKLIFRRETSKNQQQRKNSWPLFGENSAPK